MSVNCLKLGRTGANKRPKDFVSISKVGLMPPPRLLVTARIITLLVTKQIHININLHFPLLLGGGKIQDKICVFLISKEFLR